ncbi:Hint domain-containing protein [Endobacter medicaginis]|uniref:Hint domain-containing protein n=1 Tax=Endobacter medicaginis TaxID=1181271 RepID=A0A850NSN5_9PROT|nr:Hint domain-containing protein [Endobacter medicaginis]NVN29948.1 Hint domain-containing protein [Endobacter medicaginis]
MPATPQLNEFLFNQTGTDLDDFLEIKGDPDTDYSAYTVVVVEGDTNATYSATGKIINAYQLGTTNADGYWTTGFLRDGFQNGTQTVLLVKNFTGTAGAINSAKTTDLDTNDDGVFDSAPWSSVVSAFAVSDGGTGDITYTTVAAIGATDNTGYVAPVLTGDKAAGASLFAENPYTGSASDWIANDLTAYGLPGGATTAPPSGTAINTPGGANNSNGASLPGATGTTVTIQQLNGNSYTMPYNKQTVTTSSIVTAIDSTGSIGYYLQEADSYASSGVGSRAIFVYTGSASKLPAVGDAVTVTGTGSAYLSASASDILNLPELNATTTTVTSHGNALPAATILGTGGLTPPSVIYSGTSDNLNTSTASLQPSVNALDFYRSLEGQLVTIKGAHVVGATASGATWVVPDGVTLDARGGVIESATNFNTPRIEVYVDTGVKGSAGTTQSVFTAQVGDTLGDVTGILTYYNGVFEVEPVAQPTVTSANLAQQTTTLHGDATHMTFADYNIENMDALLSSNATRVSQLAQIVTNNLGSPDVLALQEIQDDSGTTNDGTVTAAQNIQAIINAIAAAGGPTYSYAEIDPADGTQGGVAGGNIRSVFLYNTDRVSLVGNVSQIGADQLSTTFKNTRLPLVGTFAFNATGQQVTLVNVHNSSQAGSDEAYGSVQQPYNHGSSDPYGATGVNTAANTRQAQAQVITSYVQDQLAANPDAKISVLGDFNDVDWSTAQQIYTSGGTLTDLNLKEDAANRYTYVFEGNSESLDHTLGTSALYDAAQFETVHTNSEYPDATRESDHDPSITLLDMTCFLTGTLIATPGGAIAVEEIVEGMDVLTASGATRAVRWLGRRAVDLDVLYRGRPPREAHPVRILADAIGEGVPARDLLVTPEHCLHLDGRLVPARMLVNGRSIRHDVSLRRFEVFHVELSSHDILLAEGLETESWLDTGNRHLFGNVVSIGAPFALDAGHASWADAAAPLATDPAFVEPLWQRFDARADMLGLDPRPAPALRTDDAALALWLDDGSRLAFGDLGDGQYGVTLPAGRAVRALLSRSMVPAEAIGPFIDDRRRLGVAVRAITLDGEAIGFDGRGWHGLETAGELSWRWMDGDAALAIEPSAQARRLVLVVQAVASYATEAAIAA